MSEFPEGGSNNEWIVKEAGNTICEHCCKQLAVDLSYAIQCYLGRWHFDMDDDGC